MIEEQCVCGASIRVKFSDYTAEMAAVAVFRKEHPHGDPLQHLYIEKDDDDN